MSSGFRYRAVVVAIEDENVLTLRGVVSAVGISGHQVIGARLEGDEAAIGRDRRAAGLRVIAAAAVKAGLLSGTAYGNALDGLGRPVKDENIHRAVGVVWDQVGRYRPAHASLAEKRIARYEDAGCFRQRSRQAAASPAGPAPMLASRAIVLA